MKQQLLALAFFFCLTSFAQQSKIDSLKNSLIYKSDRERIETYIDISEQRTVPDTSIVYLNKALVLANNIHFDSVYPIQFGLCVAYYVKGDLTSAKKEIRRGFKNQKFTDNPEGTNGHINMLLGVFNEAQNEIDSAKYYYKKVTTKLKGNDSKKSIEVLSITYTNFANLYLKSGNYAKAIEIYLKSAEMSRTINDLKNQLISLNNIASCYKEMKSYNKSLKYYNTALDISKEFKDYKNEGAINLGIGEIHSLKGDFDKALIHFMIAKEVLEEVDFKSVLHIAYQNIAQIHLNKNNISQARFYSEKAVEGVNTIKDDYSKVSVLLTNALVYEKEKEYSKSLKIVNDAFFLANKNGYQNLKKECIVQKINLLKVLNKDSLLVPLYDELLELKDSIINEENLKIISNAETKYQTEKKEKDNLKLKNEAIEKDLLITNQQEKSTRLYTALGSSLFLLFGGVFLFRVRQKSQKQQLVIEKLEAKENERNRLAGNVHDSLAGYLRTAMTRVDNLNKELKNDKLEEVGDTIELAYSKARNISKEYQKLDFEKVSFEKHIKSLLFERQELYKITIDHVGIHTIDWKTINPEIKTEFYRILQEVLLNIHKHADAKSVMITFDLDKNNIKMDIKDDGLGMDISESFESVGLSNIQARIKDLNGKIKIDSSSNNGFELMVSVPV